MRLLSITSIAWLTVRDAVRSRLLVSLAAILIIGLIGLPILITGGYTLNGQLQVILKYTLGFAMSVLSAVTLWAACGGIASEIEDRRLYLVLTKPVHRYELWLGKWLGISGLNAILLVLTGLIMWIMIWHSVNVSTESDDLKRQAREHYLLAHDSVFPATPDWAGQAKRDAGKLIQAGRVPAGMVVETVQAELIREYRSRHYSLPPGGSLSLDYPIPEGTTGTHDLILDYTFESSRPERLPVAGEWIVKTSPDRILVLSVTNYPGFPHSIVIPGNWVKDRSHVHLTYQRRDENNPATLLFASGGREPELLLPAGLLPPNLTRGLIMILFRLAFLAALGLTAGCLLSMPVAVFVSFFIMMLLALSGYVETVAGSGVFYVAHEGPGPTHTWLDQAILVLFRVFHGVTGPFVRFDPVPLLQEGRRISWELTALSGGWFIGVYTALTALIGISLFHRRELG